MLRWIDNYGPHEGLKNIISWIIITVYYDVIHAKVYLHIAKILDHNVHNYCSDRKRKRRSTYTPLSVPGTLLDVQKAIEKKC